MNKTIPLDELPRRVEHLLQAAWEKHESVILEWDGEPVAVVVPMAEYWQLHPEMVRTGDDGEAAVSGERRETTMQLFPSAISAELPADVLADYHRLVSKKFVEGLTSAEEAELARLGAELDAADAATPLEQAAWRKHERQMAILDELIAKLKALQELQ